MDDPNKTQALMLRVSTKQPDVAANRHWLARITICLWVLHIPLIGLSAPASMVGIALVENNRAGYFMAGMLLMFSITGLADSIVNGLRPSRRTIWLMRQRHVGFMLMAAAQTIAGAGLMESTHAPGAVWLTFILPAVLCVAVTYIDLHTRLKERIACPRPAMP